MIKESYINILLTNSNRRHFKAKGYNVDIIPSNINIKIDDLQKTSKEIITSICDYCNFENKIEYYKYYNNVNRSIVKKFTCSNCSRKKAKDSMSLKYGVDHVMMLDSIKNKFKSTNIEKYGVEYPIQSDIIKDKFKSTNIEKYGVDHYSKTDEYIDRVKNTNIEKYGVEYFSILESSKQNLKSKRNDIIEKGKITNIEKYSVDNIQKNIEYRKGKYKMSQSDKYIRYIGNKISELYCDCGLDHTYQIHNDNYNRRIENNLPTCTICYPISKNRSIKETQLFNYIKSIYNGQIILNYNNKIEIDIYLPELNIGFEFNGIYWHSNKFVDNSYHYNKYNYFREKNINLYFIWEDDWVSNREMVEFYITKVLNNNITYNYKYDDILKEYKINDTTIQFQLVENNYEMIISGIDRNLYCYNDIIYDFLVKNNYPTIYYYHNNGELNSINIKLQKFFIIDEVITNFNYIKNNRRVDIPTNLKIYDGFITKYKISNDYN